MYRSTSVQLEDSFADLGQYPGVGEDCDPLADLVVPKLVSQLVTGNVITLTSGSFLESVILGESVVLEAAWKVTCKTVRGALLAQVYVDSAWEADDSERAIVKALADAKEAGDVDESGAPILPEITPPVSPTLPPLISAIPTCRVYAFSRAGIEYLVSLEGYSNPSGVAPVEVEWDVEDAAVIPMGGGPPPTVPNPVFHVPTPGYSKEQATIGVNAFRVLTGRNNFFLERVLAGNSKVDENVALRLKNLDGVTIRMRQEAYLVNNKLLIALMTGMYRQEKCVNFLYISLLDFVRNKRQWLDMSAMWGDLM